MIINGEPVTFGIDLIKFSLKPEFQIIKPLTELDDDEFNVVAPEEWNDIELTVGDEITPKMLRNPSEWNFPMKIVKFAENPYGEQLVWIKRILKKKNIFGKVKEIEDTFHDLVYNWEEHDLKPHYKMVPPDQIYFSF